ncbi:MAG: outer membrane lipid asymmetry maintenance protein MlaD [Desulfovibrio sp.]|nr:outer membrane lipid asymmetry maintenance protein MlaD [Desulfovibrio sp.]
MKKYTIETAVGIFVFIGLLCVTYLTVKLGKMEVFGDDHYPVLARFTDVTGLGEGAYVEMAGVRVGKVGSIGLDPKDNTAVVKLLIQNGVRLTDDAIVSVKTSGLIGDKYIKISPGGSEVVVAPGGMLLETESAVDLTDLIGKYVFGGVK